MWSKLFIFLFLMSACCAEDIHSRVILDLPEGSNCTWNGFDGTCTSIYNCTSAKWDISHKKYPSICSFDGVKPFICCTDCEKGGYVGNLDTSIDLAYYKTGEKARDKCLEYLQTLNYECDRPPRMLIYKNKHETKNCFMVYLAIYVISDGEDAERDQYPHMALLGYGDSIQTAQWLCGGTVISERYILTAAHCISSPDTGQVKYIALGILRRSDPPELWQQHKVKRIIPHPDYKPPSKYHDIALLESDTTIEFSRHVLPACLHVDESSANQAEATGWGALGNRRELADTLQTVKLERFEEDECMLAYPKHRHLRQGYNHTTQMCYGHRDDPKDTCQGDSGGPLQTMGPISDCVFTVLGVTSYGRSCGFAGSSGMYTRVYHYVPWIESVVWP